MSAGLVAAGIRWPAPPFPVDRLPRYRRIAGWFLLVLGGALVLLLTVGVLGYTVLGRTLLLDTALSLGFGTVESDARVVPGRCDYRGGGRHTIGRYECSLTVHRRAPGGGTEQVVVETELSDAADVDRARGAGTVFGAVGLRWPPGILLSQWLLMTPLVICVAVPGALALLARSLLREDYAKAQAARDGSVVPVDLLFHDTVWRFAYRDRRGRQRFAKGILGQELALDGVVSAGAALLARNGLVFLLHDNLWPLQLAADDVEAVRQQVVELRRAPRPPLPPMQGEPRPSGERLAAIRGLLRKDATESELRRAYRLAWRLVWDYVDADTAREAFALRHQAGARLGPRRALEELAACRLSAPAAG